MSDYLKSSNKNHEDIFKDRDPIYIEEILNLVERLCGYRFQNTELLLHIFATRNFLHHKNNDSGIKEMERLEFLGDSMIKVGVTHYMYGTKLPASDKNFKWLRQYLISNSNFAHIIRTTGLANYILHEAKNNNHVISDNSLGDFTERLIGGIYEDSKDTEITNLAIMLLLFIDIDEIYEKKLYIDPLIIMHELWGAKYHQNPRFEYENININGKLHFRTRIKTPNGKVFQSDDVDKYTSKRLTAQKVIEALEN
jgi:dsRNA-specific ribonuclease